MTATENTELTLIRKNDPTFPEHLDFEQLRREGIEHISEFSGKIWTDHNLHDPGITILEMLCYALLDLGYRTQLPIEDILTVDPASDRPEDNFFTPAQILTCNPTTIIDYRKMLIDIEGVRNAWLEIVDDVKLYVDCTDPTATELSLEEDPDKCPVPLNGLYRVYLELDDISPFCKKEAMGLDRDQIIREVKKRLCSHRNLGEDFIDVCVLCRVELGLTADVDLHPSADPEQVQIAIFKAVQAFLSPEPTFYTLQELLEKGKPIEAIFEGRPYTLDSFGFVDTEELESIQLHKEIHLSDLYQLILDIEGVKSVRGLKLEEDPIKYSKDSADDKCGTWKKHLAKHRLPVLCIDNSCLTLYKGNAIFRQDRARLEILYLQSLSSTRKVKYQGPQYLDLPIPKGRFRPDLGAYDSIQQEFPQVYGIGEGGLPSNAPPERQAQALQLKGYLTFFDQLLAGYLAQLSHLRDLFSMAPEGERTADRRHTYFAQRLDSIPQVDRLIRFYGHKDGATSTSQVLAVPVGRNDIQVQIEQIETLGQAQTYFFTNRFGRNSAIGILQRDLEQGEQEIVIHQSNGAYYFVLSTSLPEIVLLSKHCYATASEAKTAADSVAFLGALVENYRDIDRPDQHDYSFEFVSSPVDYLQYTQLIVEGEGKYRSRRNEFLDHLLARFGESFTDLSLALYDSDQDILEAKANYLSTYPGHSRNRGRAFDYYDPEAAPALQVSGLEQRINALAGFGNEGRATLCNFELIKTESNWEWRLLSPGGRLAFYSLSNYGSEAEAEAIQQQLLEALQQADNYLPQDNPANGGYELYLKFDRHLLKHAQIFASAEARDNELKALLNLYRPTATSENAFVFKKKFQLFLYAPSGAAWRKSRKEYTDELKAREGVLPFTTNINSQLLAEGMQEVQSLHLVPLADLNTFVDLDAFHNQMNSFDCGRSWVLQFPGMEVGLEGTGVVANDAEAALASMNLLDLPAEALRWETREEDDRFILEVHSDKERLAAANFTSSNGRDKGLASLQSYLKEERENGVYFSTSPKSHRWELKDPDGWIILQSTRLFRQKTAATKEGREWQQKELDESFLHIREGEEGHYTIELRDKADRLLAASPLLDKTFQDPEALRQAIITAFTDKKNLQYTQAEEAWAFQVPAPRATEVPLLISYHLYDSRGKALANLEAMLPYTVRRRAFVKTGDALNLNYSFLVQGEQGEFLAYHPATYETEAERDQQVKDAIKYLKNLQLPIIYQPKYCYQYLDQQGAIVLESTQTYNSEAAAAAAFQQLIPCLADLANYEYINQGGYTFVIVKDGIVLGTHPQLYEDKKDLKKAVDCLLQEIQGQKYQVAPKEVPKKWKFRSSGSTLNNNMALIWESVKSYPDEQKAKKAYERLFGNVAEYEVRKHKVRATSTIGLFHKAENTPQATYPDPLADPIKLAAIQAEMTALVEYMAAYQVAVNNDYPFAGLILGASTETQQGCYTYQVKDKGQPLAYAPCQCIKISEDTKEEIIKGIQDTLWMNAQTPGAYTYPDICRGSLVVIKFNGQFHYQLKNNATGQCYFISYTGYPTQAEAMQAFREQYLQVIALASVSDNYPSSGVNAETTPISATPPQANSSNGNSAEPPLVFISVDNGVDPNQVDWAALFQAYPIRQLEKPGSTDHCPGEVQHQYCFQLLNPAPASNCPVDWKSLAYYESPKEAWTAYHQFLGLLQNKSNYSYYLEEIEDEDEECCYYVAIRETLLEGVDRYPTKCSAWGELYEAEEILAFSTEIYDTYEAACEGLALISQSEYKIKEEFSTIYLDSDNDGNKDNSHVTFPITSDHSQIAFNFVSRESFKDAAEKDAAEKDDFEKTKLALIKDNAQYCIVKDDDCRYLLALMDPGQIDCELPSGPKLIGEAADQFTTEEEAKTFIKDFCVQLKADPKQFYFDEEPNLPTGEYRCKAKDGAGNEVFIGNYTFTDAANATAACRSLQDAVMDKKNLQVVPVDNHFEVVILDPNAPPPPPVEPDFCKPISCRTGLDELLQAVCLEDAFYPYCDTQRNCYSFLVVDERFRLAQHPFTYHTPEERDQYLELLCAKYLENGCKVWKVETPLKDSMYCFSIKASGITPYLWESLACYLTKAEAQAMANELIWKIAEYGWDEQSYHEVRRKIVLCREPKIAEMGACPKEDKLVAHHGSLSIEQLVNEVVGYEDWQLVIDSRVVKETVEYYFLIQSASREILWQSIDNFASEQEAEAAGKKTQDEMWQYIQEEANYYLEERAVYLCPPIEGKPCGDEDRLAVHKGGLLITDLIQQANQSPFVKKEDGFSFQVYCPDFPLNEIPLQDAEPCRPCEQDKQFKTAASTGAVVWESNHTYATEEEAMNCYKLFCALLENKANIRTTGDLDCQNYSFEFTNPFGIIAQHPQCYGTPAKLKVAIEKTKACLDLEGLHLIEHILLRPRSTDKKCGEEIVVDQTECLLPIYPDCNCGLPLAGFGEDSEKAEDNSKDYIPGADPYSFWATVVLPCWPKRFRQANFREFFQELVLREAPAHIGLRFLWLSPVQLCKFEAAYRQWLRWLGDRRVCDSDLQMPKDFIQCFSLLTNCCSDAELLSTETTCNTDSKPLQANRTGAQINKLLLPRELQTDIKQLLVPMGQIRQRQKSYLEALKAIDKDNVLESKTYKKTLQFLAGPINVESFKKVVNYILRYGIGSQKEKDITDNDFYPLIQYVTNHYLDQALLASPLVQTETEKVVDIFKKMEKSKIVISDLRSDWNGEALKDRLQATTIDRILAIKQ